MAEPLFKLTPSKIGTGTGFGPTAKSTPQTGETNVITGLPKAIIQGSLREAGAVGQKAISLATGGRVSPVIPYPADTDGQRLYRAVYGTDKPVSLQSVGEEFPGVKPGSKVAPLAAVGGFALNVFGGAGEQAKILKGLTATKNAAEAASLLKRSGLSDDIVRESAPLFAKMTDANEVRAVLGDLQQLNKTAGKSGRVAAEDIAKTLGTKERKFVTSVKEKFPQLTKVAGQYIPRDTDTLAVKAKNFIRENAAAAEQLAKTGTSEDAVATASELIKKFVDDAEKATDEATKRVLNDKAAEIANAAAENLTELGRSVQAASILGRLTPEGMARFAARTIQRYNEAAASRFGVKGKMIPELTGDQFGSIVTKAKTITEMPDGIEKAMAWRKLMDEISTLVPTPLWKKFIALWKAGLLTGLKTSGLNTASNLFHGVSEVVKDVPGAAVDSVASLFTGKRALTFGTKGTGAGLKEGFGKGWRYLKTGFDERDIASKLDHTRVNFGNNKFARGLQKYEESVFRVIGSEDQPFFYGAKGRSLANQASAIVKNEGLKGEEAIKRAQDLIENPTDEMLKYAMLDGATATFQNKTALGSVAKQIQRIPGIGEFVLPFGRTPSAVATQIINYSPFGVVKTIAENIGKGKFDQRLFSQGLGRGLTGTGLYYLGYKLGENDMVALNRPTSEAEQKLWELEGKRPGYIKIGDTWRSPAVLGPAGNVLVAGAYLHNGIKNTGTLWGGLSEAAFGAAKTVKDQTFLTGINSFLEALNDPERYATSVVSRNVGSLVPTLVSDVARGTDKYERRTPGFTGPLKSRVPGLRDNLEPQLDTLGKPIETPGFATALLDPTRPTQSRVGDPVVSELRRLSDSGFSATPTQLGDKQGFKSLTPKQNTRLWQVAGVLLDSKLKGLMATPQYKTLDDEAKAKNIKNFTDRIKVEARAAMLVELLSGLEGKELMEALGKHKGSGLMSNEVFDRYLELR